MTLKPKNANMPPAEAQSEDPQKDSIAHSISDQNRKFYETYIKIFNTGFLLSMQLRHLVANKEDLWKKLLTFEVSEPFDVEEGRG